MEVIYMTFGGAERTDLDTLDDHQTTEEAPSSEPSGKDGGDDGDSL
jgi:hypothetical protein